MSQIGTVQAVRSAELILKTLERDMKWVGPIMEDGPEVQHLPPAWQGNALRHALAGKLWRAEGRQSLVMHPEVVRECAKASSSKIPTDVLRTIPYLNPLVLFAEPIDMPTWRNTAWKHQEGKRDNLLFPYKDEKTTRLIGFLTFGQEDNIAWHEESAPTFTSHSDAISMVVRQPTLTHDPDAERFCMIVFSEVLDSVGRTLDIDIGTFSVPFNTTMTMKEMVDQQLERFVFSGVDDPQAAHKWIAACYRNVIGSLMYLASTTLDAEKVPASATKSLSKRTIARKPLSLYRIGWTTGSALSRLRAERFPLGEGSVIGDLRHQQDPQHRRSHFKTCWTGPKRSIPKTVFISAYWTHRERLGEQGVNTIRKVI